MPTNTTEIRLVVFDWAGTTVDFGCFGPVAPFVTTLARHGVRVTPAQARGPMGLHKKDHLRALLQLPDAAGQWRTGHGRDWTEPDVEDLYQRHFVPLQMEEVRNHSQLVPGVRECVAALRERGIKIGTTTGYFREAAEVVFAAARVQGYDPDLNVLPDEVTAGRPAPWMIFRHMERLGVFPPAAVLKIGDTVPDIHEGRNAGAWSVGVTHSGSEVGCTEAELAALPAEERQARVARASETLRAAGAHAVLETVAALPALIADVNERLRRGERP